MRFAFCLAILLICVVIAQLAIVPSLLPPVMRPDLGILTAMAILAMGQRQFGLVAVFAMGLQADLFGSPKFGMLTLAYLLAAGTILLVAWRELSRGDLLAAWLGGVAGTVLAHFYYVLIGRLCGYTFSWGQVVAVITGYAIAASILGIPCAMVTGRWLYWTRTLAPDVRERWVNEARLSAARKGRLHRA